MCNESGEIISPTAYCGFPRRIYRIPILEEDYKSQLVEGDNEKPFVAGGRETAEHSGAYSREKEEGVEQCKRGVLPSV